MQSRALLRIIFFGAPILALALIYFAPQVAAFFYTGIVALAPLWLPVVLLVALWPLWLRTVRSLYVTRITYVTLELKPGPQTPRSAHPMELIFYSLYFRSDVSRARALWQGVVRVPWSFDVVATNGSVRFYAHVPVKHRAALEGRLRAEYRDIDIDEVSDYSRELPFNPFEWRLMMREYTLEKSDAYPLRTYVADEHGKVKRDTFLELVEELSTLGPDEHLWISFLVRPHQRDWPPGFWGFLEVPRDTLHEDASRAISQIIGPAGDVRKLPHAQQELIAKIEHALSKPSFDTGIRAIYAARRSSFDDRRASSLDTLFDRFDDPLLNGIAPYDPRERVSWPLSDVFRAVPVLDMEYFLSLYRRRAFFAPPYYGNPSVLNTEELATLFHLPRAGKTSTLSRSGGTVLLPPDNLPL